MMVMKFNKYLKFISKFHLGEFHLRGEEITVLVDSVYQRNQKDLFEFGSYDDLCKLIKKLNEIREFCHRHNVK